MPPTTPPAPPAFTLVNDCPTVVVELTGGQSVSVVFTTGKLFALEEGLGKPHQTILDDLRKDLGGGEAEGERPLVRFLRLGDFLAAAVGRPRAELLDHMPPSKFQKFASAVFEAYCAAISDLTGAARKETEQGKAEGGEAAAADRAPESSAPGLSSSSESDETNSPASAPVSSGT